MTSKKIYVLVTIDTECDKGNPGWDIQKPLAFKNIPLQKERLLPIFKKFDIRPTYLLSPEVLLHQESVNLLKSFENVELGTHLHEEFIEPNANFNTLRTENIQANLTYEIEKEKLTNLTNLFYDKIGFRPKSFRSGRYGSSKYTNEILAHLGYLVDSSIVPYTTKYFENYEINSWDYTTLPFFEQYGNKKILEVPLTLINPEFEKMPKFLKSEIQKKESKVKSLLKRLGFTFHSRQLRPYRETGLGMIKIAEHVIKNHFKNEPFVLLNIMFHSNEILENGSPYCKNKKEVYDFLLSLEELFNHLKKNHNLCSIGLGDVSTIYSQD